MTLDEKSQLVHGVDQPDKGPCDAGCNFGTGYVPAIKWRGTPPSTMADSAVGMALLRRPGTYTVYAGPSSADTSLHATFTLDHPG